MPNTPTNLPADEEVVKYLPKFKEWGVSFIRTAVAPPVAALVVLLLGRLLGLELPKDDPTVTTAVFTALSAAWYGLMRAAEVVARKPWVVKVAGLLLGVAKAPASRVEPTV